VAGFCCIWIPRYSSLAKPLYEAITGSGKDPLNWGQDQDKAFQEIKRLLISVPVLGLPEVTQPFNLLVCEKYHTDNHTNNGSMAVAGGLPVETPGISGFRVVSMSLGLGCHSNLNQGG
jgi:hypothetical protein